MTMKTKTPSWLLPTVFVALSLLSLLIWIKKGEISELIRAIGFALGIPELILSIGGGVQPPTMHKSRSHFRMLAKIAWWTGLTMLVFAFVRSS